MYCDIDRAGRGDANCALYYVFGDVGGGPVGEFECGELVAVSEIDWS